jgi:hypothetical protein
MDTLAWILMHENVNSLKEIAIKLRCKNIIEQIIDMHTTQTSQCVHIY